MEPKSEPAPESERPPVGPSNESQLSSPAPKPAMPCLSSRELNPTVFEARSGWDLGSQLNVESMSALEMNSEASPAPAFLS